MMKKASRTAPLLALSFTVLLASPQQRTCGDAGGESQNQLSTSAGTSAHSGAAAAQAEWGNAKNGLRCAVAAQELRWSKGRGASVFIALENTSGQKVSFRALPFLVLAREYKEGEAIPSVQELQRNEYWCPIDLTRNGVAMRANNYPTIVLEKGESRGVRVDAGKLGWNVIKGSTWPDRDLFAAVPAASYRLYFQVDVWEIRSEGQGRSSADSGGKALSSSSLLSKEVGIVVSKS